MAADENEPATPSGSDVPSRGGRLATPALWLIVGLLLLNALAGLLLRDRDKAAPLDVAPAQMPPSPAASALATSAGMRFEDQTVGTGATPGQSKMVTVEFTLRLADGTVVDSTEKHGRPFTYKYGNGQAIPAFDQSIATMREGGRRTVWIPADAGYPQGAPGIPKGSTLLVDVKLIKVDDASDEDG